VSSPAQDAPNQNPRPPIFPIVWDIVLNATIPVVLYQLSLRFISPSELTALIIASIFPLAKSIFDLVRSARIDPVAIIVLLSLVASGVGLFLGGSPRLLLLRESLFTGLLGLACFVSLLLPRPMMFYFGRFFNGRDPQQLARFDASWQIPFVRFGHRLITVVWGCVYVGELIVRVILICKTSPAVVLFVSPIMLGVVTIGTIAWTFGYASRIRSRAIAFSRAQTAAN
jgi:hypothetical protein